PQPASPPPPAAAKTDLGKAEAGPRRASKHRRHARAIRRHRAARLSRSRWRNVWIYRAHDRHGDRHYEYVRRKFGGYFARGRDCACGRGPYPTYRAHRWHL
ncbi:MAG: hypothetical protein K2X43_04420, partial [Hyphomonadaceae bacterium]|nr:hypothetical protein [Hyphomonadaceae bacterium]